MHVIYEDDGQLKAATVLPDQETSLQVEAASGKRSKIKAAHVLLRFAGPSPVEVFAEAQRLYVYGYNPATGRYEIVDRDWRKVKEQLLWSLTNFGQPVIRVGQDTGAPPSRHKSAERAGRRRPGPSV